MTPVSLTDTLRELDARAEQLLVSEAASGGDLQPSTMPVLSLQDRWKGAFPLAYPELPLAEEERLALQRERWSWKNLAEPLVMSGMALTVLGYPSLIQTAHTPAFLILLVQGMLTSLSAIFIYFWCRLRPKAYWARMDAIHQENLGQLSNEALVSLAWHKRAGSCWRETIKGELKRRGVLS